MEANPTSIHPCFFSILFESKIFDLFVKVMRSVNSFDWLNLKEIIVV